MNILLSIVSAALLFTLAGCASSIPRYSNGFDVQSADLSGKVTEGTVAHIDYSNGALKEAYRRDPKTTTEAIKKRREQDEKTGFDYTAKYDMDFSEDFSGEPFYWSVKEGCYNAFIGRKKDGGYAAMHERVRAAHAAKRADDRARSSPKQWAGLEQIYDQQEMLLPKAVDSYYSPNASRIQLCRHAGSDRFQVRMIFDSKIIVPRSLKATVFEDKVNKAVRVEFEGSASYVLGSSTLVVDKYGKYSNAGGFGAQRNPYGPGDTYKTVNAPKSDVYTAKGVVSGPLLDQPREPMRQDVIFRGQDWGQWSGGDIRTWSQGY